MTVLWPTYRAFLRTMAYKDKASYGSSPPCIHRSSSIMSWLSFYLFIGLFCGKWRTRQSSWMISWLYLFLPIGLLCGKWLIKIRYPVGLRNPVHIVQVSFCQDFTLPIHKALLWKMTYKNKVLHGSSPPCTHGSSWMMLWLYFYDKHI